MTKLIEDEEIENELNLEMISTFISKIGSRIYNKPDDKEELEGIFLELKKLKILINKFENYLKLIKF